MALGVAMVPEGRRVFPYLSVMDNLLMGAFLRRGRREIAADVERVFERFPRLRERRGQAAGTMSGGEQQMLAIGRALMARPRLLLLDEPSLGLAPMLVQEIARAVLAINREDRVSLILVEQNSRMALRVSSRAYALETGRVALEGRSRDLANDDRIPRALPRRLTHRSEPIGYRAPRTQAGEGGPGGGTVRAARLRSGSLRSGTS